MLFFHFLCSSYFRKLFSVAEKRPVFLLPGADMDVGPFPARHKRAFP